VYNNKIIRLLMLTIDEETMCNLEELGMVNQWALSQSLNDAMNKNTFTLYMN